MHNNSFLLGESQFSPAKNNINNNNTLILPIWSHYHFSCRPRQLPIAINHNIIRIAIMCIGIYIVYQSGLLSVRLSGQCCATLPPSLHSTRPDDKSSPIDPRGRQTTKVHNFSFLSPFIFTAVANLFISAITLHI